MSRTAKLKQERPDLYNNQDIRLFAEQADKLHDLKGLNDSPGGKQLVALLKNEIENKTATLAGQHLELTHQQMVGISAGIQACRDIVRLLENAETNMKHAEEQLDEAMEE
jgi:hypothetical protein